MSISNRIIAGFAAIIAILIGLGVYALAQIGFVRTTVDKIVTRDLTAISKLDQIGRAEAAMTETRLRALAGGSGAGAATWQTQAATVDLAIDTLRQDLAEYESTSVTGSRSGLWRRMSGQAATASDAFDQMRDLGGQQIERATAGDAAGVAAREAAITQQRATFSKQLADLRATMAETVETGRAAAGQVYERSRDSIVAGLLIAILLSAGIAWTIRRSITTPLAAFMGFVGEVGQGDLTGTATISRDDELGRLGSTLNMMVESLRGMAGQSRQATENLNAAATEIRASTQQQAASVEEQLAAVQETAATVDEITHSGAQISRRAQDVIASAQATAQTSEDGIAAIDDTVRAMDAIREQAEAVAGNIVALSEKTQAIGDIIATVNEVSERSHLLALNAAIEAAAAGESGRSFAIVASEMKMLADQAKSATRTVRSLLGEIQRGINASVMLTEEAVKRVASGKERTDASQRAIEGLAGRIQESVQTFQQIVASTNQQQIGIEQVTIALQNIRQASQQTAASTRQLDQAAGDLTQLSRTLLGITERYRI